MSIIDPHSYGVFFYADYKKIVPILAVGLHSLIKVYKDPIHVVFGPNMPAWFIEQIETAKIPKLTYEHCTEILYPKHHTGNRGTWCQKPLAIARSPFKHTLYYDCDHIFLEPPDNELWHIIGTYGMVSASNKLIIRRNTQVRDLANKISNCNLHHFRPGSGGCIGIKHDDPGFKMWIKLMDDFQHSQTPLSRLSEEYALGVTLSMGLGTWISEKWSLNHPKTPDFPNMRPDTKAIHFYNNAYHYGTLWKQELIEAYNDDWLNMKTNFRKYTRFNHIINKVKSP